MQELTEWEEMQIRSAILTWWALVDKRVMALKGFAAKPNGPSEREAESLALECAAYAESALGFLRTLSGDEQFRDLVIAAKVDSFLAKWRAAGKEVSLGYWDEHDRWVGKTTAGFLRDLKTAYSQRAALYARRAAR